MRQGKFTRTKYYVSLVAWLTATISLIVVLLSVVTHIIAERIFIKNEFETSNKILNQIKFNIEFVDKTIKDSSKSLFLSPGVSFIMNSSEGYLPQNELYYNLISITSPIMLSNTYIHSICIYNSVNEQYYYTGKPIYFDDQELKAIIKGFPNVPKQKPIFRKIAYEYGSSRDYENVLTYIMYETTGPLKKIDNALIINVKPEWILDNISGTMDNKGDRIFVMDEKNGFLGKVGRDEEIEQSLLFEFTKYKNEGGTSEYFVCEIMNKKYLVTYNAIKNIGFVLFRIQPVKEVYQYVDILKLYNLGTAVIALMFSVVISIIVSTKLYKPIGTLVKGVSSFANKGFYANQYDEISYLNNVYKYSMGRMQQYDNDKSKYRSIVKLYWLKKMLTDNEILNQEQYAEISKENNINVPYGCEYFVCLLMIDNFQEFQSINNLKDRSLARFVIINIMTEVISEAFTAEGVDMSEEQVALIIGVDPGIDSDLEKVSKYVKQGQEYIHKYFDFSVTASLSDKIERMWLISDGYLKAQRNSVYRFVLGRKSIITAEKIQKNSTNSVRSYSKESEKKLIKSIESGNMRDIDENLRYIIDEISLLSYDNISLSIVNLLIVVKNSVDKVAELWNNSSKSDSFDVRHIVYEIETIEDFYQRLLGKLKDAMKTPLEKESDTKYEIIAETAVSIINKDYSDVGLCTDRIASLMKINPRYLSRVFKDTLGTSITNYINDVRLKRAAELLSEDSEINVYNIISEVGYDNESYFYRMFKSKYRCTPKEYALLKNISETHLT